VVATGWSLGSEVEALFIDLFYIKLAAGSDIPCLEQNAKGRFGGHTQLIHPYFWARFALFA